MDRFCCRKQNLLETLLRTNLYQRAFYGTFFVMHSQKEKTLLSKDWPADDKKNIIKKSIKLAQWHAEKLKRSLKKDFRDLSKNDEMHFGQLFRHCVEDSDVSNVEKQYGVTVSKRCTKEQSTDRKSDSLKLSFQI